MSSRGPGNRDFGRRDHRTSEDRSRDAAARAASRRRRPPPRRRPPSGGHTFLWLLAIVAVVVLLAYAGLRGLADRQDPGDAVTTAAETPNRVVFPEGLRREDIAAILDEKTGLSGQEYLSLTAPGARGRQLARAKQPRSLEGFLFPATYDVYSATTVEELVEQQLTAFADRTAGVDYTAAARKNLTRYDVLIIASMVEREVRRPDERKIVAGIMYNRLRNDMRLDIDATVQYALGSWKTDLTAEDLDTDSPYNTRRYKGLPPGPICNPGEASIRAAARPAATDYLYYVAKNDGTGGHYFARTDAEFQQAVARSRSNAGG
ncbi:MAG: endolytic transglycosylase MltG [Thermoleophilia bacterium]|nr:endolytic transglycosylase MltG [Thermoleophilia bacterium]